MRLKKIKLAGFKSFVDPTSVEMPSNLVGIVGPNGCGKSNTIDAVRWVMGESSARHLRGQSMEDVIFNGSSSRKPVGQASVELVFDNTEGRAGGQYAAYNEISVKRLVTRDGQSKYFLNNTRCRRRDIADIFLGTGLGPRSYAIIEQGMISRLIEARPEDMRVFIEEAAGISKYKERRRETENRIRHTRENLERLNDLREELARQLEKLQRQARTAERYRELKAEARRLQGELLVLRWQLLDEELAAREGELRQVAERHNEAFVAQRTLEAQIDARRENLAEANESFNALQADFYETGAQVSRLEQDLQHRRQRLQEQREELAALEAEYAESRRSADRDEQRLAELGVQLDELEPELELSLERLNATGEALEAAEEALQDWQETWETHNRRLAEPTQQMRVEQTRQESLKKQLEQQNLQLERLLREREEIDLPELQETLEQARLARAEGEARAQAALERQETGEQAVESLRQQLEERREQRDGQRDHARTLDGRIASLETLQQAALSEASSAAGDWLQAQGLEDAPRLAQLLQVTPGWETAAETVLAGLLEAALVDELDDLAAPLQQATGVLLVQGGAREAGREDRLSARVKGLPGLERWLDAVHTADDLAAGLRLRGGLAAGESVITRDGAWIGPNWLRMPGEADVEGGVLAREQSLRELRAERDTVGASLAEMDAAIDQLQGRLQDSEQALRQARQAAADEARAQLQAEAAEREAEQVLQRAEQQGERLAHREEELRLALEEAHLQLDASEEVLQQAREAAEELAMAGEALEAERSRLRERLEQCRQQNQAAREEGHRLALRMEGMRRERDTLSDSMGRLQRQLQQQEARRHQLQAALETGEEPLVEREEQLEEQLGRRLEKEAALGEARRGVEAIEHALREREQQRLQQEQRIEQLRGELEKGKLAEQETRLKREAVAEEIAALELDMAAVRQDLSEQAAVDEWQHRLGEVEGRIRRLGAVNLAAIDEYREQQERKQYLDEQQADLEEALATLEAAMARIDRETRQRFRQTFEEVNLNLQELFPRLFGGGQAYLEMTGEDLLDTGVAIMARPPGKRITNIHLMSGGEKAMTAVAMIFSIFRLNPAPFCMLDEVDAPLDEANVGRFCEMVREMSDTVQFIFITHNKTTMQLSSHLTGVTMHEPGVSRIVSVDVAEAVRMVETG